MSPTRPRRQLHSIVLLAAVLLLTLLPVPAQAAVEIYDPPAGDDQRGGGSRGERVCDAQGNVWFFYADGRETNPIIWLRAPNPICVPDPGGLTRARPIQWGGVRSVRTVGWEVWRFYGTKDRVYAWSVSRINMPVWGSERDALAMSPHPDDARNGAPAPQANPWRASYNRSQHSEMVSVSEDGKLATNPPFRFSGPRCDNTPLRNPAVTNAIRSGDSSITNQVYDTYTDVLETGRARGGWGWRTASALANLNLVAPPSGPADLDYDNGVDCTSPFEYAPIVNNQIGTDSLEIGFCIMPVQRLGTTFNVDGQSQWIARFNGGLRYAPPGARKVDFDLWREVIEDEVTDRIAGNVNGNLVVHRSDRIAPGPAFDGLEVSGYSQSLAAGQAAGGADCRLSAGIAADVEVRSDGTDPRVIIDVDIPEVFQIGGQLRTGQTIWAGHSELLCDGGECPTRTARQQVSGRTLPLTADHLTGVRYQLTVDVDGLRACRTSNVAEQCDYTIDGPQDRRGWTAYPTQPAGEPRGPSAQQSTAAHRERRQRVDMTFYAATNPGENVSVSIRDVSATYATYTWGRTQLGVTSCAQAVDGARLGTTQPAAPGTETRRWDGAPYHPATPAGSVTQYERVFVYDEAIEHVIPNPVTGLYAGRRAPWTEYINGRYEERSVTVDLWSCSAGVFDDVETSSTITLTSEQIQVRGLGSRPVIGVNQRR